MSEEMEQKLNKLSEFLEKRADVLAAFLFGSFAKDRVHRESDVDIAVYFKPSSHEIEYEEEKNYAGEDEIWSETEKILNIKTDFVVLNRASSTLADSIIKEGRQLVMNDTKYFARFANVIDDAAEYYREYMEDFIKIKARSNSLSSTDRERLIKITDFLEQEIKEYSIYSEIDQIKYQNDKIIKRSIERWVENMVNSSIDIAKIILASEKKQVPETYRLIIENLGTVDNFDQSVATLLSGFSKMRNLLAHEYLDIRFAQIKKFTQESEDSYKYLICFV